MNVARLREIAVVLALIGVAAGYRLIPEGLRPSNFQPIGAVALFAGFYFYQARAFSWLVPMAAMILSNLIIGSYDFWQMLLVNFAIVLPALYGHRLRAPSPRIDQLAERFPALRGALRALRIGAYSVAGSLLFFVVSNFAVWAFSGMYSLDFTGLVQCYLMAFPFYGQDHSLQFLAGSLLGDLSFNALFFGAYALASLWGDDSARSGAAAH